MISVIIPTYNREATIKRAILSVLNQTICDLELIIVDDCSCDNTEKIVKEINDNRISYYKLEKNSGACAARNFGINVAKGEYVAFQDSDDEWLPTKLEKQLEILKKEKAVAIFNKIKLCDDQGNYIKTIPNIKDSKFITYKMLLNKSIIGTPALMIKRSVLEDIRFDNNLPRLQDWDFVLTISKKYPIYYLNEILVNSYVQKNSISRNNEKGVKALDIIYKKYGYDIINSKLAYANYLMLLADYQNKKECKKTLKQALNTHFSIYQLLKAFKIYLSK